MANGDNLKAFLRRGLRSQYRPAAVAALAIAGSLMATPSVLSIRAAAAQEHIDKIDLTLSQSHPSAADLLGNQSALRRLVTTAADLTNGAEKTRPDGTGFTYAVANLDRAILHHIATVQETLDPTTVRSVDRLYGIDDGMWAWMMRNHATEAGLDSAMEGIKINDDGSIDATNASRLARMLDLKNDPVVATRLFARWLASEIMEFDGKQGRPPTPGETEVIALSDSQGGLDAAFMAEERQYAKLGAELRLGRSWKRPLFVDHTGWRAAKNGLENFERRAAKSYKDSFGPIPVRQIESPQLDEDFTAADLRKDPERFARIVADAVKWMPKSTVETLERVLDADGLHLDNHERLLKIGGALIGLTAVVDGLRGKDVAGGIYAVGEGQWLQAAKAYGDPAFVGSFLDGIEQRADGSVRAASAEQFGTFMRLRDHGPIATQIVLDRMISQTAVMQKDLGRLPAGSEIVISHLFGIAAGEEFARAADANRTIEQLRFSPDDPRNAWVDAFAKLGSEAARMKVTMEALPRDREHLMGEFLERHAELTPAMKP